jgi:hypothetical protein
VLDVGDEGAPRLEAVAPRQLEPCLLDADARRGRDAVGATFVVIDVRAERLLVREVDEAILGSSLWPT